nr:retrovirus-related Pol polyprotein from transposon TNT 1-94 [Tanacetum cinerariifolium]
MISGLLVVRKVKESLNVTFDETPLPSKTSPLVDDGLDEEEATKITKKKNLENDTVDETLEIDDIVNIKESRNHPLENLIGNLNQKTLRSQAQNQSNLFCFISTIEPKNVNDALGDECWIVAMQEELNQFIANNVWRKVEESLNVTFDETPPPYKTSPLVDDDLDEEEAIKVTEKKNLENDIVDETLEIEEIVNIKESRNHPLGNVIGNLNQRTLRSQAQNQSNFFCFISTIEPKNVNEVLGDESWIVAMQEELNQFIANDVWELVPQPRNMTIIGTKWTRNCVCSMGTVEDKILVPKPPKNYARCTRYGYLVDGPHCQRCALLRQEIEENLVTYSPDFQNTSEPSNASTNVVNAPREPYVVK